ncbi:MAG: serine/threonine protein kinase [Candidatus Thiothrix singaporensis]|uniref:Serine/threonine protein kinase n=1 Tax=Candidatus Thiothrix singaporensis TaxID=2799669 RepID=A0A7L6AV84_9GAMM|nr:MAG: serine/threonine protein kinase [Candidatus Thiothrix singaporensis]
MSHEHRQALPAGARLHEYELLSVLGSGGFGVVYLAHDQELHQQVVIKEYLPLAFATRVAGNTVVPVSTREAGNFRWGLDSFISEARTLAEFRQCPNVVSVLRYFKANNTGYMVMEYAGAVSLQDFLEVHQTLTEKQLLALVLPLLDALEVIHAKGVIHRDIKPGNILINDDSQPVLIDFGAARQAIGERTMSLTTLLTPEYAPFEQHHKTGQQGHGLIFMHWPPSCSAA